MAEAVLQIVHRSPGRVRLSAPCIEGSVEEGRRIAQAASGLAGVAKVEARTATGSLIVFHEGDWEPVAERLAEAAGARIEERPADEAGASGPNLLDEVAALIEAFDSGARQAFGGRTNASELAFLGLALAGLVQLGRGQIVGPAATLFGQALTLLAARRSGRTGG